MAIFEHDQVSLYYEERGGGYAVLLLAPGGMNSRASFWGERPESWIDPIADLSDEFRVIAMDQRNAGRSRGPVREGDGWHTYASDALALIDHLGIGDLAVMGGCIGVSYCLRLCAEAPGRVRAAVLQNPIGRGSDDHDHFGPMFDAWADTLMATRRDVAPAAIGALRANLFGGDFVFSVTRDLVQQCDVPLLVLPGDDAFHPPRIAREIAALAPQALLIDRWRPSQIGRQASVALVREFIRVHAAESGDAPPATLAATDESADAEQEILRLEEQRRHAILHNDAAAMNRLLAEDFIVTDNEGRTHDRADELSLYKNRRRDTQSWEASDVRVRVYGDAAVVTERVAVKDVLDGKPRDVEFRLTTVWIKRRGTWQVVARHGTRISEPPPGDATAADHERSTAAGSQQDRNFESEAQARGVIDAFNAAGKKRDVEGLRNALNFPFVRIASGKVSVTHTREDFTSDWPPGAVEERWHHSTVDSVQFIQSSSDKVHASVVFSRYKADGTRYATYRTLRIITKQDGHWGIQCSSSFAP